jgi:hypothetical protein
MPKIYAPPENRAIQLIQFIAISAARKYRIE